MPIPQPDTPTSQSPLQLPTKNITFLGSKWSSFGVKRKSNVTRRLAAIWDVVKHMNLQGKPLQRVRGLFNYYFGFAGYFNSVVNRILKLPDKWKHQSKIRFLLKSDFISFRDKPLPSIKVYVDASLCRIAAVVNDMAISIPSTAPYIAFNELYGATLGSNVFTRLHNKKLYHLSLFNRSEVSKHSFFKCPCLGEFGCTVSSWLTRSLSR